MIQTKGNKVKKCSMSDFLKIAGKMSVVNGCSAVRKGSVCQSKLCAIK